jgi:hypothetical protein
MNDWIAKKKNLFFLYFYSYKSKERKYKNPQNKFSNIKIGSSFKLNDQYNNLK